MRGCGPGRRCRRRICPPQVTELLSYRGLFPGESAQADTKQRPVIGIADVDAVIVGITFNGERCHEELALGFGTLERGAIVRKLDAIVIAYTVGPEIPMEIIARHRRLSVSKKMAAGSDQVDGPPRSGLLGAAVS